MIKTSKVYKSEKADRKSIIEISKGNNSAKFATSSCAQCHIWYSYIQSLVKISSTQLEK